MSRARRRSAGRRAAAGPRRGGARRLRRPAGAVGWALTVVAVLFSALLLFDAVRVGASVFLGRPYLVVAAVLLVAGLVLFFAERLTASWSEQDDRLARLRLSLTQVDSFDPPTFALAVRDLLQRDGCATRHRPGSPHLLAETPEGHRLAVRVHHTRKNAFLPPGAITAPLPLHPAPAAILITNGSATRQSRARAAALGIHLIDRPLLHRWCAEGKTLPHLLPLHRHPRATPD